MRQSLRAPSNVTGLRLALACACGLVLALTLAGAALADSMSLSAPQAVQELASQVSYSAVSEEAVYPVVAVNSPGVPCAPDPKEDDGQIITPTHMLEGGTIGSFNGAANYTPTVVGTEIACGWLEEPAGLLEMDGGPITASGSLPVQVGAPRISLALSFPRPVLAGRAFTLDLNASSEVKREVVVVGIRDSRQGCPIDYAALHAQHMIETAVNGGPSLSRATVNPLNGGKWIFCAWADPPGDRGLYPQASTSIVLNLSTHSKAKHHAARPKSHRRASSRGRGRRGA